MNLKSELFPYVEFVICKYFIILSQMLSGHEHDGKKHRHKSSYMRSRNFSKERRKDNLLGCMTKYNHIITYQCSQVS